MSPDPLAFLLRSATQQGAFGPVDEKKAAEERAKAEREKKQAVRR
jgi:hypothetical protein